MSAMTPAPEPGRSPPRPAGWTTGDEPAADDAVPDDRAGPGGADVSVLHEVSPGPRPTLPRSISPAPSRKWVKRAETDRRAMARLQFIESEGVIVLNDRRVPGSKSNIKLIAISPAGVFVIDAKGYKGLVHTKREGPIRNLGPTELHVGRKNCTSSVYDLADHLEVVRGAMSSAPWGSEVPVHALLCLTRAEWGFASPIEISNVWVGWPRLVANRLQAPEVMDSPTVQEVSEMIADRLP